MDEENNKKETTHYLSVYVIKNNNKTDHLLESGIVNVGLLKDDRKYDSKTEEKKKDKKDNWDRKQRC